MVIYFSWSGNTKAYAEELARKKCLTTFRLQEKKERKNGKISFYEACMQGVLKKKTEIAAMPDLSNYDEIYICTPVWASGPAPAIRYFLKNAELRNKKIHFVFTYGGMTDPSIFKNNICDMLNDKGCIIGNLYAFTAKFKQPADNRTIENNINRIISS